MAAYTVNREGLTFTEWVCAAGLARFDIHGIAEPSNVYPRRVRKAWRDGEDPSDHRAESKSAPVPYKYPVRRKPIHSLLHSMDRSFLRHCLRHLRRYHSSPREANPAGAQCADAGLTLALVRAEYRRRGWKVPKPTRWERSR